MDEAWEKVNKPKTPFQAYLHFVNQGMSSEVARGLMMTAYIIHDGRDAPKSRGLGIYFFEFLIRLVVVGPVDVVKLAMFCQFSETTQGSFSVSMARMVMIRVESSPLNPSFVAMAENR